MVSRGIVRFASLLSGSRVPNALPARAPIFLAAAYRGERVVRNTNLLLCADFGTDFEFLIAEFLGRNAIFKILIKVYCSSAQMKPEKVLPDSSNSPSKRVVRPSKVFSFP